MELQVTRYLVRNMLDNVKIFDKQDIKTHRQAIYLLEVFRRSLEECVKEIEEEENDH